VGDERPYMRAQVKSGERTHHYSASDLAIVIPTKDRPAKIANLLASLVQQTVRCGRIIIVDSGEDLFEVVARFQEFLPIEYYRTSVQGQIHQRNRGLSLIEERTPLVCLLDDDIILDPYAFEAMISFWNNCELDTAGVSFNIVNMPRFKHTLLKSMIGMSSSKQGKVLLSGYNVFTSPVEQDIRTQWLCGGATVWKKKILDTYINKEIPSKWAICEDVIFSYPIGKRYPLYVCAGAKVRHEHVLDHKSKSKHRYYGRTITLWRLYFVESHAELSRVLYFWMLSWQILARCFAGLFLMRPQELQYGIGQMEGALAGLKAIFRRSSIFELLVED